MERLCGSRRFCYACLSLAPDLSPPSVTIEEIIVVLTLVFRFVAVVSLAFCSWPALAQQFSADMVRLKPPSTITTKVYVRGDKMRFEITGQVRRNGASILDLASRTSLMIIPDNKTCVKSPASAAIPFFHVADSANACPAWEKSVDKPETCTNVGEETINGHSTVKYKVKYKGMAGDGDTGYAWVDRNLKFVIKWEGEKSAAELQNIREGPQASTLFEVPEGYEMFDLAAAKKAAKDKAKTNPSSSQRRPVPAQ